MKTHLAYGPLGSVKLRTACGRDVTPKMVLADSRHLVDCSLCTKNDEAWKRDRPDCKTGSEGYHWKATT